MNLLKQMLKSYTFLSLAIGLLLCYFRISGLDPQGLVFSFSDWTPSLSS